MSSLGPKSLAVQGFWHPGTHSYSFPFLSWNSQTWYFLLLGKKGPPPLLPLPSRHCSQHSICFPIVVPFASAVLLSWMASRSWAPGGILLSQDGLIPSRCSLLHLFLGACCTCVGPRACLLRTEASIPLPVWGLSGLSPYQAHLPISRAWHRVGAQFVFVKRTYRHGLLEFLADQLCDFEFLTVF